MDPGFSDNLAITGFAHRATVHIDGSVIYSLKDGSGSVRVPGRDWGRLSDKFVSELALVKRRTRFFSIILFPAVFAYALTLGQIMPFSGLLILAAIFLGPLAIYFSHSLDVNRISTALEKQLHAFPRCGAAMVDKRRFPRALEIASLFLVGPYLLLAIIGEIGGPDLFRGTPLVGIGIGPLQIAAFGLIGLRIAWPRIAPSLAWRR